MPRLANMIKVTGGARITTPAIQGIIIRTSLLFQNLPSGLLNALGAVSRLSFKDFTIAAIIGKLPSTAIEAMIGHDAVTAGENPHRLVFSLVLAVVMILGFIIYEKRQKKNS